MVVGLTAWAPFVDDLLKFCRNFIEHSLNCITLDLVLSLSALVANMWLDA